MKYILKICFVVLLLLCLDAKTWADDNSDSNSSGDSSSNSSSSSGSSGSSNNSKKGGSGSGNQNQGNQNIVPKTEINLPSPAATFSKIGDVPPFGYNLFSAQFPAGSKEPVNPNYQLVPGDQIDIQTWGAVNYESTATVDNQGNIFLPEIGPIRVQGVMQSDLNGVVKQKVAQVYKQNVQIYTALRGSLPISIFVTGVVKAPGRYVGVSTDSVLDYIYKAGGVDPDRGSYRSVTVVRNSQPVQNVDIYDFLLSGNLPKFQIKEGDIILVGERGKVVAVKGDVKNPFKFEFKTPAIKGAEIIKLSSPLTEATNAQVSGTRDSKPYKSYLTMSQFAATSLDDGDKVEFSSGTHEEKIAITITGRHLGPKAMVVPLDTKLTEVLNNVPIDPNLSNINAVYIKRHTVAERQKQAIQESLQRLQEALVLSRASGQVASDVSPISDSEENILNGFIDKAKQVTPDGKVVVTNDKGINNIALEDGDEVVIPQKTDVVTINGEVLIPKAIVWEKGDSVRDYIEKAGGFTDRANTTDIVVIKANGESVLGTGVDVTAGDEIIVMPEVKLNNLEIAGKVITILYQVAVATAIPFTL